MKKILSIIIIGLLLSSVAMANQVELKGFKLGMSKKEFKKTWKSQKLKTRHKKAWGERHSTVGDRHSTTPVGCL